MYYLLKKFLKLLEVIYHNYLKMILVIKNHLFNLLQFLK